MLQTTSIALKKHHWTCERVHSAFWYMNLLTCTEWRTRWMLILRACWEFSFFLFPCSWSCFCFRSAAVIAAFQPPRCTIRARTGDCPISIEVSSFGWVELDWDRDEPSSSCESSSSSDPFSNFWVIRLEVAIFLLSSHYLCSICKHCNMLADYSNNVIRTITDTRS